MDGRDCKGQDTGTQPGYLIVRSYHSVRASNDLPEHIIAFLPESVLSEAGDYARCVQAVVQMLPPEVDEVHVDLGSVLCMDSDVDIDPSEPQLDLLIAVTSIRKGWALLSASDYEQLDRLRGYYTFTASLRAVILRDEPPQLYVELEDSSQFWFDL